MLRQAVAVMKSGDRTEKLRSLQVPTLVIHGESDKMVDASGGRSTASSIPNAELVVFEVIKTWQWRENTMRDFHETIN